MQVTFEGHKEGSTMSYDVEVEEIGVKLNLDGLATRTNIYLKGPDGSCSMVIRAPEGFIDKLTNAIENPTP